MRHHMCGGPWRQLMTGVGLIAMVISSVVAAATAPPQMVTIPAGAFIMGSNKIDRANKSSEFGASKPWYVDEHPQHTVRLHAYAIDVYEVTNAHYREFLLARQAAPPEHWLSSGYLVTLKPDKLRDLPLDDLRAFAVNVARLDMDTRAMDKDALIAALTHKYAGMDSLPVVHVSWNDANAYCQWAGKHLPTEAQWEKAARGAQGNEFVWGNKFKEKIANVGEESWEYEVAPVGSYPEDKSVYGVYDLTGNAREWVADWYKPYPGAVFRHKDFGEINHVVRGAGAGGAGHYALSLFQRAAYRGALPAEGTYSDVGFRCVKDGG